MYSVLGDPWLLQLDLHRWTDVDMSAQTTKQEEKSSQNNPCESLYVHNIAYVPPKTQQDG